MRKKQPIHIIRHRVTDFKADFDHPHVKEATKLVRKEIPKETPVAHLPRVVVDAVRQNYNIDFWSKRKTKGRGRLTDLGNLIKNDELRPPGVAVLSAHILSSEFGTKERPVELHPLEGEPKEDWSAGVELENGDIVSVGDNTTHIPEKHVIKHEIKMRPLTQWFEK